MGEVIALARRHAAPEQPVTRPRAAADVAVVRAAIDGDASARERLFRDFYPMVLGMSFRLLGHDDDARDNAQEAFVHALRSLGRLRDPSAFRSWLAAIVVHRARARIKRNRRRRWLGGGEAPIDPDQLLSPATPPDVARDLRALYGQLQRMEPEERIAIVLRLVEGMTVREIGAHMGLSPATVKRRLAAAQTHLGRWGADAGGGSR